MSQPSNDAAPLRLHIGGRVAKAGWTVLNAQAGPDVDIVGDLRDLSGFADASVTEIYASHVLEHLDQATEAIAALRAFHRILTPGGRAMIAVPDMGMICRMMIVSRIDTNLRLHLMRIIYGGQVDAWDYHKSGFTEDLLGGYLSEAGFRDIHRVERFGLFDDTSGLTIGGAPVSLNVVATKTA